MRYIGSKVATLPALSELVRRKAPNARSLCDPFAGTCTVARHFKREGLAITTGDLLRLSYVFQLATVRLNRPPSFRQLSHAGALALTGDCTVAEAAVRHLSTLPGKAQYVTEHFSPAGEAKRLFFTVENAMRVDAARSEISGWSKAGLLSEVEEAYLLVSLIEAADKVANTAGTYLAHLKAFTRKALRPINFAVPPTTDNGLSNVCKMVDARDLSASSDILYLDPPYNERDYAGYYHFPETLACGDFPTPAGKSGAPRPMRQHRSDFCSPPRAARALEEVVRRAQACYIIVHYAAEGLIAHDEIMTMLYARGPTTFQDLHVRAYSTARNIGESFALHRIYFCGCQRVS